MDYIAFEPFPENDALPSPQPSLSIPLKSNIENLGAKLSQFNNLKQFLQLNAADNIEEKVEDSKLAEKYALLSLEQLTKDQKPSDSSSSQDPLARSEALSTRLSRGLNPTFGDASMRELFTRLESKSYEESMDHLVDAGIEGSIARKNLRSQVEAELIKNYASILADYAKPVKVLKTLGERVSALVVSINETKDLLEKDVAATSDLMSEIDALNSEKKSIDLKKSLLVAFRQKFTLNEYEQYVLEYNDINQEFFDALLRAEKINEDCLILLAVDNPKQGRSLLAKNNDLVSKANQKITTFCTRSLSNIYSLNNRERLNTLHMCLDYLSRSPEKLNSVLESFVKTRSASLLDEFSSQINGNNLSDGKSSISDSRPVYFSSHDPVRYIADLLAYVHSIVANEAETVKNLFEGEQDLSQTASKILEQTLGSLAKPIKAEIDRVVSAETRLQITCQIMTHLELYHLMFNKISDAIGINESIAAAMLLAKEKVELILSNRLAAAKTSNLARLDLSSDLQPPEWIIDFYSDILPVLDTMTSATVFDMPEAEHKKFLELIVDQPISVFEEHLNFESSAFDRRDLVIFKLNFLDLITSKVTPIVLLSLKVAELVLKTKSLRQEAQEIQLQELLRSCSLTDFYNVTNMIFPIDKELLDPSIYQAITENKLFNKEAIAAANEDIQAVLPTALMDSQSTLIKLNNPIDVKEIVTSSFEQFQVFYTLFSAIVTEYLQEPLLSWSSDDVGTMLGIDDSDSYLILE